MRRLLFGAALAATLAGAGAAAARADGLPVPGAYADTPGVASVGGDRYLTLPAGGGNTALARLSGDGSAVLRHRTLREKLTVPLVALDGTSSGLSADGRTLVLIRPRTGFPQKRTHMVVLGARALSVHRRFTLPGDFSFDAVSPDGRTAYVVHYTDPRDPTRYVVRALDTRTGALGAEIVDKRNPDEVMRGLPLTRTTTPDGRWAYTLYDGNGHEPFIHALDTADGVAACIDLEALTGRELVNPNLGVDPGSGRVTVSLDGQPALAIDPETFAVSEAATLAAAEPAPAAPERRRPASTSAGDGSAPWVLAGVIAALLGMGAAVAAPRLRRRPPPSPKTTSVP